MKFAHGFGARVVLFTTSPLADGHPHQHAGETCGEGVSEGVLITSQNQRHDAHGDHCSRRQKAYGLSPGEIERPADGSHNASHTDHGKRRQPVVRHSGAAGKIPSHRRQPCGGHMYKSAEAVKDRLREEDFGGAHQVESYLELVLVPQEWSSSEIEHKGHITKQATAAPLAAGGGRLGASWVG